jgi:hypothetical protein
LDLIEHCPSLALARDKYDRCPLYALVSRPSASASENQLVFWNLVNLMKSGYFVSITLLNNFHATMLSKMLIDLISSLNILIC